MSFRVRAVRGRASCLVIICAVLWWGAPVVDARSAPAPASPGAVSLQATDLPGFTAVDSSIETFQDPTDQGADQAFIQCAGSTPLLDEFDSGSHATVSQVYGQGTNTFGTPVLSAASAVFTDGSATDAQAAFAALAGGAFQQCWASTQDSLNSAQGLTVPVSPSTVSPMQTPAYGDAATGFQIDLHYSALGATVNGQFGVSVIQSGSYVVMLLTLSYNTGFPDELRTGALARIAGRLGVGLRSTTSTTAKTPCLAPDPVAPVALLQDNEVDSALGSQLTYAGWTETPAAATGSVAEVSCTWNGRPAPTAGPLRYDIAAMLTVSAPYPAGAAKAQFDSQLQSTQPLQSTQVSSFNGVGDAAFWIPAQDWTAGLTVLSGNRLLTISVTVRTSSPLAYQPAELQLAALAVSRLGTGSGTGSGSGSTSPASPSSIEDAACHLGLSLGVEPPWLDDINKAMQDAAKRTGLSPIPIPNTPIGFPARAIYVAPAIDPGTFTFCGVGLTATLAAPPWSQSDSTQLNAAAPGTTGVSGGTSTQFGPFVYSAPEGAWSTVDKSATPLDQPLVTKWSAVPTVVPWNPSLGLTWGSQGLQAELTLAQVRVAAVHSEIKLVVHGESVLSVDLGPSLVLSVQISNKQMVDEMGKDLAQQGGDTDPSTAGQQAERTAAQDLSAEAGDDLSAAMKIYDQQMLDITGQLAAQIPGIQSTVDEQLLAKFTTWFDDLQAGSAAVQELAAEGVTADEVPVAAEAALEAELGGDSLVTIVEVGCDVFLDGACLL